MPRKITIIISLIPFSNGFTSLFNSFSKLGLNFNVILINKQESVLYRELKKNKIDVVEYYYTSKFQAFRITFQIYRLLKRSKTTVVHTHLLEAGMYGGLASYLAGVKLRLYTRHHSNTHVANKRGRIYDKIIHSFYHKIICPSEVQKKYLLLREKVTKPLIVVPNFFDPKLFEFNRKRYDAIREKYSFSNKCINIGINARWTQNKGHDFMLPALLKLSFKYIHLKVFMFNCSGDYSNEVEEYINQFPKNIVFTTEFEEDIISVYRNLDIFIHCPVNAETESFGLVYAEAMTLGIPSVFTLSGIAQDHVINEQNALVAEFCSVESIYNQVKRLIENTELRKQLGEKAKSIQNVYSLERHITNLTTIYTS